MERISLRRWWIFYDISSCIDFVFPLRFSSLYGTDTDLNVLSMEDAKLQLLLYILLDEWKKRRGWKKKSVLQKYDDYTIGNVTKILFHFTLVSFGLKFKTHRRTKKKFGKKRSDFVKKMSNAILALFENNMMSSHC